MRTCTRRVIISVTILAAIVLLGCGNGPHFSNPALPPVFISSPSISAAEGAVYSYQLAATAPPREGVSYTLTAAPAGATLNGTRLTWTPTPSQSRQPSTFTVVATTDKGATATQTWTVTPNGTIHVTWVDTEWSESGSISKPHDWTLDVLQPSAVFLQPDGSVLSFGGSGDKNGDFYIPNVPGGYYWLEAPHGSFYWTSSSNIDLGHEYHAAQSLSQHPSGITTKLNLNVTGFEPFLPSPSPPVSPEFTGGVFTFYPIVTPGPELLIYLPPERLLGGVVFINWNSRNFQIPFTSNLDFTGVSTGAVLEYLHTTKGTMKLTVLGPTARLSNLTIGNGNPNDIDVPLVPSSQKSISLSINGSAWQPLFMHVAPGSAAPYATPFSLSVASDVSSAGTLLPDDPSTITLLSSTPGFAQVPSGLTPFPFTSQRSCGQGFLISSTNSGPPVILTDLDLGTVGYGDPFPESWPRYLRVCQFATADIPSPDGSSTQQIILSNGVTLAPPISPVGPLIGPVEAPTINDQNLFTASTVSAHSATLKWEKPSLGNPIGYGVSVYTNLAVQGRSVYTRIATLNTGKTTVIVPPGILQSGTTYFFLITSVTDGRANIETSPNRLGFPAGNADIISAPITIGEL